MALGVWGCRVGGGKWVAPSVARVQVYGWNAVGPQTLGVVKWPGFLLGSRMVSVA